VTADELDRLTIGELRAAADRVAAALAVLREAGAWTTPRDPARDAAIVNRMSADIVAPEGHALLSHDVRKSIQAPVVQFSPSELAERKRLLQKMRPELPPEIAAIEDA
jgi:hypothetical protein